MPCSAVGLKGWQWAAGRGPAPQCLEKYNRTGRKRQPHTCNTGEDATAHPGAIGGMDCSQGAGWGQGLALHGEAKGFSPQASSCGWPMGATYLSCDDGPCQRSDILCKVVFLSQMTITNKEKGPKGGPCGMPLHSPYL